MACDGDEQRWAEERAAQLQADEETWDEELWQAIVCHVSAAAT